MLRQVDQLIRQRIGQVKRAVARAVLNIIDDSYGCSLQGLNEEVLRKAELWQHYGFSSRPLAGAECAVLFVGGENGHLVLVAENDRRYRPKLEAGEAAFHDWQGNYIRIYKNNDIEINSATRAYFTAPLVELGAKGLADSDGIVRKADLQKALDDMTSAVNAKFAACQGGSGVGSVTAPTAQASAIAKAKA
jgi:phage gp45-like